MIFEIDRLKKVMDEARNDPALQPIKNKDKSVTTFCNLGAFRISQDLGFNHFWNEGKDRIMLANEAIKYMDESPHQFSKFYSPMVAYNLANAGYLIYAAQHGDIHGHLCAIYPIQELVTSGKLGCQVPMVNNIGKENKVFGLNWAFSEMPDFYLCIS